MSKCITGKNDLLTLYPEISSEWHLSRNGSLQPEMVSSSSGRKVWWQCKEGHEWEALISNRTKKESKCPYCAGKMAIVGVNDLATINPKLACEWHKTKNGTVTPKDVMSSSKHKFWWECQEGHEWEASLDSRDKGSGCPYCSGRLAIKGKNDLISLRPEIAALWNHQRNSKVKLESVTVASGRKFWWIGKCGHEWETKVSTMCDKNTLSLCPICSDQNRTSFPEQAIFFYCSKLFENVKNRYGTQKKELDIFVEDYSFGIEYDGLRYHTEQTKNKEKNKDEYFKEQGVTVFRLKESSEFETRVDGNIVFYRPWDNYSRLDEAILLLLNTIFNYYHIGPLTLDINCERDNSEILALFLKKKQYNGFAAKHKDLLAEWNGEKNQGLDPWLISEHSNQKFWWICKYGHEWKVSVGNRVRYLTGCPVCSKEKQISTYRTNLVLKKGSLRDHFPQLALEWCKEENLPLTPDMVTAGSSKKVVWKCSRCGNVWSAYISNRTRKGQGCPVCKRSK